MYSKSHVLISVVADLGGRLPSEPRAVLEQTSSSLDRRQVAAGSLMESLLERIDLALQKNQAPDHFFNLLDLRCCLLVLA